MAASILWSIFTSTSFLTLLLLVALAAISYHYIVKAPFKQYSNLPQQKPHWFMGNKSFGAINGVECVKEFYNDMKKHRFCIFWEGSNPCLFITDLDLVKKVQVTDFDHFGDLGFVDPRYRKEVGLVFGLADLHGEEWKRLKKQVAPAFSMPRVRKATTSVNKVAEKMNKHLEESVGKGEKIDLYTLTNQFAMTTIASIAFGVEIDCFKDGENDFMKHGSAMVVMWRFMVMEMFPNVMRWFKIGMMNPTGDKFFQKLAEGLIKQRQNSTVDHNDVMHSLVKASKEDPELVTTKMMMLTIAQFFTDGYWTYTEVFTGIMYMIAVHPEVQEKIHEELDCVLGEKSDVTEEDLKEMVYLEQVLSEGLRYMVLPNTSRYCTRTYKIPDSDFTIPKGMKVLIPTSGLHFDPEYWSDPEEFDPDRFSVENKSNIVTGAFQPFGFGPKGCIGYNLMRMEAKVMFAHMLRRHKLEALEKLPRKPVLDKESFLRPIGLDKITLVQRA